MRPIGCRNATALQTQTGGLSHGCCACRSTVAAAMQNKKSPPEGRLFNIKTHGVLFPFSRIANADARDSRIANSGKRGLSIISLSDKPFVILIMAT